MRLKTMLPFLFLVAGVTSTNANAYETLVCSGQHLRTQRQITLDLQMPQDANSLGGFQETLEYKGPYPVSQSLVGAIEDVVAVGADEVHFTVSRKGTVDAHTKLPRWYPNLVDNMPAVYNRTTKELTVETGTVPWHYQGARVLNCSNK